MSKTFQQNGDQIDFVAATGGVAMNEIVTLGDRAAVSLSAAAGGATAVAAVEGVFSSLTKATGVTQAFAIGTKVYATAAGVATITVTSNKPLGWAMASAATGDTVATVKLGAW